MGRLIAARNRSIYVVGFVCFILIGCLSLQTGSISTEELLERINRPTDDAESPNYTVMDSRSIIDQLMGMAKPWEVTYAQEQYAHQLEVVLEADKQQHVQSNDKSSRAMMLMEPRQVEEAMYVLNNFHSLMPMEWDLFIVCSLENHAYMKERADKLLGDRKVQYLPILPSKFSRQQYNKLFLSVEFWNQVPYETVLVFQTDSILCANSPSRIEDFMHYKYLGCALGQAYGAASHHDWSPRVFYGSGGLTIRNVQYQKDCLTNPKLKVHRGIRAAEDVFFSRCAHEGPESDRAENVTVLQQFCTQEALYQPSFGMHKFWDSGYRFAPSHVRKMIAHCPEVIPLHPQVMSEPAWNDTSTPEVFDVVAMEKARRQNQLPHRN